MRSSRTRPLLLGSVELADGGLLLGMGVSVERAVDVVRFFFRRRSASIRGQEWILGSDELSVR
jgi:hypothetical protein